MCEEMSIVSFRDFCKDFKRAEISYNHEDQGEHAGNSGKMLTMMFNSIYVDIVYRRVVMSNRYGYIQLNNVKDISLDKDTCGTYRFSIYCDRNGTQTENNFIAKFV